MPWFFRKENGKYCVYKGTKQKPEKKLTCHGTAKEAQAHVGALMSNVGHKSDENQQGGDIPSLPDVSIEGSMVSKLVSYKSADGHWRWMAVSSVAVLDREDEVVSEKAYDDAISAGRAKGFGELDLVHIPGTDVGDCDLMIRLGNQLIEGGRWRETEMAGKAREAVGKDPDFWGVSLKFLHDPGQFEDNVYTGGIRVLKRTVLPKSMAASYGTAIRNIAGGTMKMNADQIEALKALGQSDDEIAALEEKMKSVEEADNVVEKAEDTGEDATEDAGIDADPEVEKDEGNILQRLYDYVINRDKEESLPAATENVMEVEQDDLVPELKITEEVRTSIVSEVQEGLVEAINKSLEPLGPTLKAVVDRLFDLEARVKTLSKPIEEQVADKLSELPPVVKISMKEVKSAEPVVQPVAIPTEQKTGNKALMAEIVKSVGALLGGIESRYTT